MCSFEDSWQTFPTSTSQAEIKERQCSECHTANSTLKQLQIVLGNPVNHDNGQMSASSAFKRSLASRLHFRGL